MQLLEVRSATTVKLTEEVLLFYDAGSNVVSVAEHVVMMILTLVRNYMPAYKQVIDGEWNVAEIARK